MTKEERGGTLCPQEFVRFAHRMADLSRRIHRRYFRSDINVEYKPDGSPVTKVDREVESVIRDELEKRYPAHGLIGEEYPPLREAAEFVWLLDPLDGTEAFLAGVPIFGALIGLAWEGQFILGLIDQAISGERWLGADGCGTMLNGQEVVTRKCESLSGAILYVDGLTLERNAHNDSIARVGRDCRRVRYGVECYTYGLLASGYIDIVIDRDLDIYDFAPLEPVVRNAGGKLCDWQGKRLRLDSEGTILAVGDVRILDEVVERLACERAV